MYYINFDNRLELSRSRYAQAIDGASLESNFGTTLPIGRDGTLPRPRIPGQTVPLGDLTAGDVNRHVNTPPVLAPQPYQGESPYYQQGWVIKLPAWLTQTTPERTSHG